MPRLRLKLSAHAQPCSSDHQIRPLSQPSQAAARPRIALDSGLESSPRLPSMASPAAADIPNGISTPPTTASNPQNNSPSTAPNTQSQPQSQSQSTQPTASAPLAPAPPSHPLSSLQDDGKSKRPRDARLIHLLLARMGIHAYTERVPLQLLDFAYRYTSGVLSDAVAYEPPSHASSSTNTKKANKDDEGGVSLNAVRTAVASRAAMQFSPSLPKDYMSDIAMERNRIALPRVEREFGVRLPPERYCFTGVGWGLKGEWEEDIAEGEDEDAPAAEGVNGGGLNLDGLGGGVGSGGPVGGDTVMGGMEEEEQDEDEFEEVMGLKGGDREMADG